MIRTHIHATGTKNPTLPGSMVSVPGILAPGMVNGEAVNLLPYFNGGLMSTNRNGQAVSVNFLDGGGAAPIIANPTSAGAPGSNQEKLFTHLYQFFGKLLGCSQYGNMGFPAYQGGASMYTVHQFMDLDSAQNTWFIEQVGLAASSFGASAADVATVAMSLNNTFNYRCSPAATVIPAQGMQLQSICQNATCPLDPKSTCAAYPNNGAVMMPKAAMSGSMMSGSVASGTMMASATGGAVSQISDNQPQAPTSAAVSQISDHQPQAPTSAAVTQISDHQPQAPTSAAAVSQISDHQPQAPTMAGTPAPASTPQYTGAAAANAVPAALAGAAGIAAYFL